MRYLARRWLGYGRAEWDALPWFDQQMYMEGMAAEIEADREAVGGADSPTGQPRQVGPGVTEHTEQVDFTSMPTAAIKAWTEAQPGPI